MFVQSPAFALAAVAALTLGIGVNTAIFSVVNAVLLRPMPFPEPDRMVFFMSTSPQGSSPGASPAKFQHFREQTEVTDVASAFNQGVINYTDGSFPEQFRSGRVSSEFFRLFGAQTILGRTFSAEEDRPGGDRVVVLSNGLWATRFNRDPAIVGKAISLGGLPYTVIGVLGEFHFEDFGGQPPQLWIAVPARSRDARPGALLSKRRPAEARRDARAGAGQAAAVGQGLHDEVPEWARPERRRSPWSRSARSWSATSVNRSSCWPAQSGSSCSSRAPTSPTCLLVRATGRKREVAIRAALGGSRGRIIAQVLTESLVLSIVGGVLGLALGTLGIRALLSVNTAGLPRVGQDGTLVGIDWRVLAFTIGVSLLTGLIFGLIPALQSSKTDLTSTLKETGGRSGTGFRQNKTRSVLVVTEVALALTLLIGSALLIRSAIALSRVDPGFDPNNVLTMRMSLTGPRYQTSANVDQVVREGVDRLKLLPGVVAAAGTCCVPLQGGYGLPFVIAGRPLTDGSPFHGGGQWINVTPGYFDVFKIPVKKGRAFNERDDSLAQQVVIINEAMANQFWKDKDPLNERLTIGKGRDA